MIIRRGTTYHLKRRRPKRFATVDPRAFIYVSLMTDSLREAEAKAERVWDELIAAWEAKLDLRSQEAEIRFTAARRLAQARGVRFLPVERVVQMPLEDLVERIEMATGSDGAIDPIEADAVLGIAKQPPITISRALEEYWSLTRDRVLGKTEVQQRRWRNPRIKAVKNFISVVGDIPIEDITADDMLDFRDWWIARVEGGKVKPASANKDFIHLSSVLKTVNQMKRLSLNIPTDGLALKAGPQVHRLPFSEKWIRERLLAEGSLSGLNDQARCVVLTMVNTGARPSEITGLLPHLIDLEANIPHIKIRAEGRTVKTAYSERDIPLAGVSLEAMRECRSGFPRYPDAAALSALVNQYLRANSLAETSRHTLYGLRHSFEDRLLAKNVPDRLAADLMGHKTVRERYGAGASLAQKFQIVQKIAL